MPGRPDTSYTPNPWMKKRPVYGSYHDQIQAETLLEDMALQADEIAQIRPRVGNGPFPPRFGYEKHQPTIEDVLTIGPTTLVGDSATRQDSGLQGSPRNSQGQW